MHPKNQRWERERSRKIPRSKTKPRQWFWNWFEFVRFESGTNLRDLWRSDMGFVLVILFFFFSFQRNRGNILTNKQKITTIMFLQYKVTSQHGDFFIYYNAKM